MAEEAGKRNLSEISIEDEAVPKKQQMDADSSEFPPWAIAIMRGQNEILGRLAEMDHSNQALRVDVSSQGKQIVELDSKLVINEDRIERLENLVAELADSNKQLQGELDTLTNDVDVVKDDVSDTKGLLNKQIDNGLRDHITFYGVPKGAAEKHWDYEGTTKLLAEWLASVSGKSFQHYDDAIIRAHRGPANPDKPGPPLIYCKIRWRVAAAIRDLFMKKNHKIGTVTIKEKFSEDTQQRVNAALIYRKSLREAEGGKELKIKVDYPAKVMVKAPGQERYSLKKVF